MNAIRTVREIAYEAIMRRSSDWSKTDHRGRDGTAAQEQPPGSIIRPSAGLIVAPQAGQFIRAGSMDEVALYEIGQVGEPAERFVAGLSNYVARDLPPRWASQVRRNALSALFHGVPKSGPVSQVVFHVFSHVMDALSRENPQQATTMAGNLLLGLQRSPRQEEAEVASEVVRMEAAGSEVCSLAESTLENLAHPDDAASGQKLASIGFDVAERLRAGESADAPRNAVKLATRLLDAAIRHSGAGEPEAVAVRDRMMVQPPATAAESDLAIFELQRALARLM